MNVRFSAENIALSPLDGALSGIDHVPGTSLQISISGNKDMTEDFRLSAEKRELLGSANTRRLRRQGRVPANLYGFKKDSVNVSVLAEDIEKLVAGGSRVCDVAIDGVVEKAVVQE
ncbi:MAG: hypothetical protein ABGZ24_06535, partial [Fuerstiella sp.]